MRHRVLAFAIALLPACNCADDGRPPGHGDDGGSGDGGDGGPDGGDGGCDFDAGVFGRPCEEGDSCDDSIDCTIDSCAFIESCDDPGWYCRNAPDDHPCADTVFCNGNEICDPRQGCVPGPPESCSDEDVCTIDTCNETDHNCVYTGRDFDADGHTDWHCKDGDDCDDGNPRIWEGAPEICGDTFDNDCNGLTDSEEACEPPGFDWCADAVDVSGGGVFELEMAGAFADYALSCGFLNFHDVALTFTLDAPMDVDIEAEAEFSLATVALGDSCTDDGVDHEFGEIECNWGFPGRIRRRSLPAGTYYVIIATQPDGPVVARVSFSDPTPPEPNEACGDGIDVSAGGVWEGSFVDVADDHATSCGFSDAELVYFFTIDAPTDVVVAATADDDRSMSVAVQSVCGDDDSEVRCSYGAPSDFRLYSLAPGTYYLLVESGTENDFVLEVSFEAASSPPEGDTCDDPIDVSAGGVFAGDIGDMQDDYDTGCGFHYREEVYELTLSEVKDVYFEVESGTFTYLSIRSDCDNRGTEQRCVYGDPSHARFRSLAPGTYYALVESFQRVDFDMTVEITDPVPIVDVVDNDVCDDATFEISVPEGGVFRGDTTGMGSDYGGLPCGFGANSPDAAFRFVVDDDVNIQASLEGTSYDAVLHLHSNTCAAIDLFEGNCNDDWFGGEAFITDDLPPDVYFLVVDGFGAVSDGEYLLDVTFEPL